MSQPKLRASVEKGENAEILSADGFVMPLCIGDVSGNVDVNVKVTWVEEALPTQLLEALREEELLTFLRGDAERLGEAWRTVASLGFNGPGA